MKVWPSWCFFIFFCQFNAATLLSRWLPLLDLKQWANTGVINQVHLDFLWFIVGGSIHTAAHWLFLASDATEAQLALLPTRVCAACSLCLYSQNVRREWKARDVCARFLEAKLLRNCPQSSQRLQRLGLHFQVHDSFSFEFHRMFRRTVCSGQHRHLNVTRLPVPSRGPGAFLVLSWVLGFLPQSKKHACETNWELYIDGERLLVSLCSPAISCGLVSGVALPSPEDSRERLQQP